MSAPLFGAWLALQGRDCLLVGGGAVATRRAHGLVECGARVRVIAPRVTDDLAELAVARAVILERRAYRTGDVGAARVVCAATSSRAVNALVGRDARAAGALVNLADDPAGSDFQVAAVVRRAPIALALGTGGLSPAATAALRAWLAAIVTPDHARAVELLGQARGLPELAPAARRAAALLAAGDAAAAVQVVAEALHGGKDHCG